MNPIETLLTRIANAVEQMATTLAPKRGTAAYVKFNPTQAVAGYTVQVPLNRPYNNIQVSLLSGEVWMYYGDGSFNSAHPGTPDKRFGPTTNPLPLPFADRRDTHLTFYIPLTSQPANGTIEIQFY